LGGTAAGGGDPQDRPAREPVDPVPTVRLTRRVVGRLPVTSANGPWEVLPGAVRVPPATGGRLRRRHPVRRRAPAGPVAQESYSASSGAAFGRSLMVSRMVASGPTGVWSAKWSDTCISCSPSGALLIMTVSDSTTR